MSMKSWSKKVTVAGTTYQDDDLVGAKSIKFVLVNKQIFTLKNSDYTFDTGEGEFLFATISLTVNDSLVFMYKK